MGTRPTQNQMIAAHLNDGHTITPIDALNMFGCFRLGARIADLKKMGMDIKTRIVHDKATGKRNSTSRSLPRQWKYHRPVRCSRYGNGQRGVTPAARNRGSR